MIKLDKNRDVPQIISKKQYDTLEKLTIELNNNNIPIKLSEYKIRLECFKSDVKIVIQNENIIVKNTNQLEILLDPQITIVEGEVACQIVLVKDGLSDTSFTFYINVQPSIIKKGSESNSVVTILDTLIEKIDEAIIENEKTENLIATGGAATKGEVAEVSEQLADIDFQNNKKKMRNIIGAIRNTGNGFEFISDSAHEPINGASVVTEGDRITINYGFNGSKVGTLLATPDETLAKLGYIVGTSVGLDNSKIYVSKQDMVFGYLTKSGGDSVSFSKTDNISNGIVELVWEISSKRLKITHDKCYSPIPNIFTRNPEVIAFPIAINPRGGFNTTYIGFKENKSLSSIIRYLGTTFTSSGDNGGVNSMSWDSVNSRLTVNHKSINNLCINLTSRTMGLEVIPYIINNDSVVLEFYKSGQKITSPTTDINFILNKQSDTSINITPPDGTIVCLSYNGRWEVPPSDITHLNSNIWIYGTMQI